MPSPDSVLNYLLINQADKLICQNRQIPGEISGFVRIDAIHDWRRSARNQKPFFKLKVRLPLNMNVQLAG